MIPEEMKRLMEIIDRIPVKWNAAEGKPIFPERPETVEALKTMKELHARLEKLLEHDQRKIKEFDESHRRDITGEPGPDELQ